VTHALFQAHHPLLQTTERLAGPVQLFGPIEDGPRAVDEQHADIAISALADAAEQPA